MSDTRLTVLDWLRNRGYPCSIQVIVGYTGFSKSTVENAIRWSVKKGDIIVVHSKTGPRYKARK